MIKGQISGKLVSSGISHVAFASVLLGENPSEEVDDFVIIWAPVIDFHYELKARKVKVDFIIFDALYR